jgi:hypothetical protein
MNQTSSSIFELLHEENSFFETLLTSVLTLAVKKTFPQIPDSGLKKIKVSHPNENNYGDCSSSIAMIFSKD